MVYAITAFAFVFLFLMISLIVSTKSTRTKIVKAYHMEIQPMKLSSKIKDTDYSPGCNYELNESDVQQSN